MSREGSDICNGVNYTYKFCSSEWHGSYECRVHRSFLNRPTQVITKEFLIGQHAWQLELKHRDNGNFLAYARYRSHSSVMAYYFFTVIHPVDSSKNKWFGDVGQFGLDSRGPKFIKLASSTEIKDENSGFLVDDSFTVRLELRLKVPQNEIFLASSDRTSAQCTWQLEGLDKSGRIQLKSDFFDLRDSKLRLYLYLHGRSSGEKNMSLYLHYYGDESILVSCTLSVMNQCPQKTISKEFSKQLKKKASWNGFPSLLSAEALENEALGFVTNGWITLNAFISIAGQQDSSNPQSTDGQQDSSNPLSIDGQQDSSNSQSTDGQQDSSNSQSIQSQQQQQRQQSENGDECVLCLDKVRTAGVLHGNTTHKCYCKDCAEHLERQGIQLNCPICDEEIDLFIKHID